MLAVLLKKKIRFIKVYLRRRTDIVVETATPPKTGKSPKDNLPKISFGVSDINDSTEFVPAYYEITGDGRQLNIYTYYDINERVFAYTPGSFKISLPEGCNLHFLYTK